MKKSIWTCSLCPDLCCSYSSLIVSAAGVCAFFFAYEVRLKPPGQQLMDKDHTKNYNNYTSSAHVAALSPSRYSLENKYTDSLLYEFVCSKKMVGVPVVPQRRRAARDRLCLYTVIKFHCVVFLTSGTNITHLF